MTTTNHLSLSQAAALLGRSPRFVGNLREMGFISTEGPGRYPLVGLIRGVIAYNEDLLARQAETARQTAATDARTREIELRIKRKLATLIEANVPGEVIDEAIEMAAAEMRTVPARMYADPARRADLAAEIEASIARIQTMAEAAKARLVAGDFQ